MSFLSNLKRQFRGRKRAAAPVVPSLVTEEQPIAPAQVAPPVGGTPNMFTQATSKVRELRAAAAQQGAPAQVGIQPSAADAAKATELDADAQQARSAGILGAIGRRRRMFLGANLLSDMLARRRG